MTRGHLEEERRPELAQDFKAVVPPDRMRDVGGEILADRRGVPASALAPSPGTGEGRDGGEGPPETSTPPTPTLPSKGGGRKTRPPEARGSTEETGPSGLGFAASVRLLQSHPDNAQTPHQPADGP